MGSRDFFCLVPARLCIATVPQSAPSPPQVIYDLSQQPLRILRPDKQHQTADHDPAEQLKIQDHVKHQMQQNSGDQHRVTQLADPQTRAQQQFLRQRSPGRDADHGRFQHPLRWSKSYVGVHP